MIYCGVQLFPHACSIVALSEAFAIIDQDHFAIDNYHRAEQWLDSLKLEPFEEMKWFFDENDMKKHEKSAMMLQSMMDEDDIFVIKHRKIGNIMQFLYEWMAQESMLLPAPDKAFILASAVRLFDENERVYYACD